MNNRQQYLKITGDMTNIIKAYHCGHVDYICYAQIYVLRVQAFWMPVFSLEAHNYC